MEQQIQIAEHEELGRIRFLEIEGAVWFVGKDVADALGYTNGSRDINRHVDEDDRKSFMIPQYQNGTLVSKVTLINESGLYSLILSSKLPTAKQFKHWVTSEVLPQIRKTGRYSPPGKLFSKMEQMEELCNLFLESRKQGRQLQAHVEELQPKARYCDLILQTKNTVPVSVIAKDYGLSARAFNTLLHELEVQFKVGNTWVLYQQYADHGYTKTRTHWVNDYTSSTQTYWTQKGRMFLYNLLAQSGYLPMMEEPLLLEVSANR